MHTKTFFQKFEPLFLVLLALVFIAGLMFASMEIPRAVDRLLHQNIDFLDVATGQNELSEYKTELFFSHYHIRLIGYACLGLVLILIVAGFVLEKHTIVSTGAVLLFLPVFGHFAATMFFLGGLAFLRLLWLPFLDISFDIMRLGDIVLLPYNWILNGASLIGINLYQELPFIITGIGIFIFLLGVLAWMYGRIRNRNVTDFWIYRLSRHPQYLGWIIWSYGMFFLPGSNMKRYVDVANTLPWLLATMIIIGVALLEERKMNQRLGDAYEFYRNQAPFMFPLPLIFRNLFSLPLRLVFRKAYPDRKPEIAAVITFYTVLCILLSAFSTGMISLSKNEIPSNMKIERLVHTIKTAQNRGDIRNAATSLAMIDGSAVDSLITFLGSKKIFVRWYCADALGSVRSGKVVQPLADLLNDPDPNVRRAAAGSLGGSGSDQAVPILIDAFLDPDKGVESSAARSLGMLKSKKAVPVLIQGLKSDNFATARWSAWALGEIGAKQATQPLITCLERKVDWHYFMVGDALQKLGSARAVDAYIAGLKKGVWWMKSNCAAALGELKAESGFNPLIEAARNGEVRIRRAAILALSKYPAHQTESIMKEALEDEDWEVRLYAEAALKKIRDTKE